MGDVVIRCPLCCNNTFNSKELLIQHLSNIIGNLFCPVCTSKWASVAQLMTHLSQDNCSQLHNAPLRTILLEKTSEQDTAEIEINNSDLLQFKNAVGTPGTSLPIENLETTDDVTSMYAELMKPTLQSDLEFMKDGDSQYVIIAQDQDGTVVTKQNNDGTISLTAINDSEMKFESNEYVTPDTPGSPEESQEALYSCNTCGVSFTSVIDHIQNYHNDQDVVVEEPIDEVDDPTPLEYESVVLPTDKQTSRRVITETGVIVETPLKETGSVQDKGQDRLQSTGPKRYLRLNNICDSVIRNLKQDSNKSNPSHKVLVKEVLTKEGELVKYYHCIYCNLNVTSLDNIKNQPCKSSKHSCLQCPVSYDNAKSLCAHMKVHKVKNTAVKESSILESFECEICCTVFPTNKSLKLHKRMHDPIKSRQIEAPRNSSFSEMRYLCTICQKMIPIDYRKIHENSHVDAETLNCGICNKKFTSKDYLEMHMNVHNMDKAKPSKQDLSLPYTCLYCERRFARPHEKVKHERIHTGEKPHSCDICGKSFRVSYCLTLHMRTHTGARPYCCAHCGKRFKAHSVYNHHLLTHSEVRAYKCPYCPKAFKTSVQLAGHKNSHTKPFSCIQCNRPFASLYAVRVHTETHSRQNNLKFSCSLCGASYARAFALKDHMKQLHKDHIKSENVREEWVREDPDCNADDIKTIQNFEKNTNMVQLEIPADELIIPN